MAFKKGQNTNRSGRPNHLIGAHGDLIAAWDKVSGPETAKKLMKSALDEAIVGREIIRYDSRGNEIGRQVVKDFEPIGKILPFIARKMPETLETPDLAPCTPEELAALDSWWTKARANLGADKPKT
jgi:hypothetical protein